MWQTEIIVTLILDDGHADARLHAARIVQLAFGVLLERLLDLSHDVCVEVCVVSMLYSHALFSHPDL